MIFGPQNLLLLEHPTYPFGWLDNPTARTAITESLDEYVTRVCQTSDTVDSKLKQKLENQIRGWRDTVAEANANPSTALTRTVSHTWRDGTPYASVAKAPGVCGGKKETQRKGREAAEYSCIEEVGAVQRRFLRQSTEFDHDGL
ncbi:hypothetical protein FB451DRAFT_1185042 [Mycena latifolia]|nr:hypothetical protein FB451DRAFT_1185042 [Mycena latifolia]